MASACATFLGLDQWEVDSVGYEICLEKQSLLLAFPGEKLWVSVESFQEVIPSIEDELGVSVGVQNRRRVSYRDVTGRFGSRQVKVLVDGVQGYRE